METVLHRQKRPVHWVFLAPVLLGTAVFVVFPVLWSLLLSFTRYEIGSGMDWVGTANYESLASSAVFSQVLGKTLIYVLAYVPLCVIVSYALASLVYETAQRTPAGARIAAAMRNIFFLPVVTSMVAAGLIWGWIFHADVGILNYVLSVLGIDSVRWLEEPGYAMAAMVIVGVWKNAGYNMMLLLAGFANLPKDVEEAAELDGATRWKRLWRIRIPLLAPILFFVTIVSTITAFQVFEQTYVLTKGGPSNSTLTLSYYIWQMAFEFFNMGQASALAYVLFLMLALLTAVQFFVRRRLDRA